MKKIISVVMGMAVLLLVISIVSCVPSGVSQKEYKAVVAKRDAALAQVTRLQGKYEKAKSELSTAQRQIQTLKLSDEELKSSISKL